MARKTDVYTWRVSSTMKASLEEMARGSHRSVAQLLDEIVTARLGTDDATEEDRQRRLHAGAAPFLGCITGDVALTDARARERVRDRLKRRHPRAR